MSANDRAGLKRSVLSVVLLAGFLGTSAWTPAKGASAPLPPRKPALAQEAQPEAASQGEEEPTPEAAEAPAGSTEAAAGGRGTGDRPVRMGATPLPLPRPSEIAAPAPAEDAPQQMASVPTDPQADGPMPFQFPPLFAPALPPEPTPATAPAPDEPAYEPTGTGEGLPAACAFLVQQGVIAAIPEKGLVVPKGCGLSDPVHLSGIRLKTGVLIDLKPAAVVRCETAVAVAEWVREDLAPAVAEMGAPMVALEVAASFACRPRNNLRGARLSEHGFGRALDVGGFEMADHSTLEVKGGGMPTAFQVKMRESACTRFMTVLGPGSDGYHEDHIHVDLAKRRNDLKLCRWRIKGAPGAVATRAGPP